MKYCSESKEAIEICLNCARRTCDRLKAAEDAARAARRARKGTAFYRIGDVEDTMRGWSARSGIAFNTLWQRMNRHGMSMAEALQYRRPKARRDVAVTVMGETRTVREWCALLGMKESAVRSRMNRQHESPDKAIEHFMGPWKKRRRAET